MRKLVVSTNTLAPCFYAEKCHYFQFVFNGQFFLKIYSMLGQLLQQYFLRAGAFLVAVPIVFFKFGCI